MRADPAAGLSLAALAVLQRHPRDEFERELVRAWRTEAGAVPDGRAAWLRRYASVLVLVRLAPLARPTASGGAAGPGRSRRTRPAARLRRAVVADGCEGAPA
ncbi:hypothetical protein GCM10027047_26700 [Rhodococcus aerolatus]